MKDIIIETSKRKLFLLLLGCITFIIICVLFIISPDKYTWFLIRNEKIIEIIGYVGAIFFGISTCFIFIKLFDKKPGLIINEKGIFDNSSAISLGLIEWDDIINIKQKKIASTNFLLIEVINPEKYIEKTNGLKKISLQQNINIYGTPITLTSVGLKYDFDELNNEIFRYWEITKQKAHNK